MSDALFPPPPREDESTPIDPVMETETIADVEVDVERAGPIDVARHEEPDAFVAPIEPLCLHEAGAPAAGATSFEPVSVPAPAQYGRAIADVLRGLLSWTATLASAAVYATLIVTFGAQVARVEGHSMQPTLNDQDRLIVNKAAYLFADPRPGDIVMLFEPDVPDRALVKRVIGEPGDMIRIVDGRVFRNDVALAETFIADEFQSHDDFGPVVVRSGYYFVMGDHRNNSLDSRDFGEVPKKYILGKVPLRWWPLNQVRVFSAPAAAER